MPFLKDGLRDDLSRAHKKLGELANLRDLLDRQLNRAMGERVRITRQIDQLEKAKNLPNVNNVDLENELIRQKDILGRLTEIEIPWLVRMRDEAQAEVTTYQARITSINNLLDNMVPEPENSSSSSD